MGTGWRRWGGHVTCLQVPHEVGDSSVTTALDLETWEEHPKGVFQAWAPVGISLSKEPQVLTCPPAHL